jgi:NitT/TauT family transport system ATP-binding protein
VEEAVFLSDRVIVLTPRPGRVRRIVDIQTPRPRAWRALVDDADFRRTTQQIIDLLGDEGAERPEMVP